MVNVGGNWNNTLNAGPWYFNANNSATNTNSNIGGRNLLQKLSIKILWPVLSLPLGKKYRQRQSLVGYLERL